MNKKTKLINFAIHILSLALSLTGVSLVCVFQYFAKAEMTTTVKIAFPLLIAGMIVTLTAYGWLKKKIDRRLQAIETAKELGQVGTTGSISKNLLGAIGLILPLIWVAVILVVIGDNATHTGIVLFEIIGILQINTFGNIICDANTRNAIINEQVAQEGEFANIVAQKLQGGINE